MKDFCNFIFHEEGFSTVFNGLRKFYNWNEVEKIIAYKVDLISEDVICIELFFKDFKLLFTEETKGWDVFLDRMHQNFPYINQNWRFEIVKPAFATNETILFQSSK